MPLRRLAPALALTLALIAACSVSSPKLAAGPPVTTGDVSTTTTTIAAVGTSSVPGSSASSIPVASSQCPASKKIDVSPVTKVATTKKSVSAIQIYPSPDAAEPCATLVNPDPDYRQPPVFVVVDQKADWVQVALPIRPNESTGWVRAGDVAVAQHDYRIDVSLSGHRVRVFKGGERLVDTAAGIGKGETPTPPGVYYLVALIKPTNKGYGPYAYALSGHTTTPGLETFGGGEGRLGLHGTDEPRSIGRDASHGCIRIPNSVITRMAETIGLPLGVPVVVTA